MNCSNRYVNMLHEIPDIRLDARLTHVLCSLVLIADLIWTVLSDSINFIQNDLRLVEITDKARTTT